MTFGETRSILFHHRLLIAASLFSLLPLRAGMIPLQGNAFTPTDYGTYQGGTVLYITVTGTVAVGAFSTNPDGSPATAPPNGYEYFSPSGSPLDISPPTWSPATLAMDPCPGTWAGGYADSGTNLGGVAANFSATPFSWTGNCGTSHWVAAVSYSNGSYVGQLTVPTGGADLYLLVADTYYPNNEGAFNVTVTPLPEPSAGWLVAAGMIALAGYSAWKRRMYFSRKMARN